MPHTRRKKKLSDGKSRAGPQKKFSHSKREYINSEDGWTQVADKGWRSAFSKDTSYASVSSLSVDMNLEEMVQEHQRHTKHWESSDACRRLKSLLSEIGLEERHAVKNIVCLGLGSLQALSLEWRRSSHSQLAALTTISQTLNLTCQVIMQDPRFTTLDKLFLTGKGCQVVDDPEAFQQVSESSFVYAIHFPLYLLWKVKEKADPVLLISNDLRNTSYKALELSPALPSQSLDETKLLEESLQDIGEPRSSDSEHYEDIISMIEDCQEVAFPQLRYDFSDTMIYWRRSKSSRNFQDTIAKETPGNLFGERRSKTFRDE